MLSIIVYLILGLSIGVWVGHFIALNYLSEPSAAQEIMAEQAEIIEAAQQLNYQAWIAQSALHSQAIYDDGVKVDQTTGGQT